MKTYTNTAIIVAVVIGLAIVGCKKKPPGLTGRQVDQLLNTQEKLASEQAALGHGRDSLEADRRRWGERERKDPIIAESIQVAASLIICALPIAIVAALLWKRQESGPCDIVEALSVLEILGSDNPPRLDDAQRAKLTTLARTVL